MCVFNVYVCLYFRNHKLSDTVQTTPVQLSPSERKRKQMNANFVGTLSPTHFSSPNKARRHLNMVKLKYQEKQIQNHNLQKKLKKLTVKLKTFD